MYDNNAKSTNSNVKTSIVSIRIPPFPEGNASSEVRTRTLISLYNHTIASSAICVNAWFCNCL